MTKQRKIILFTSIVIISILTIIYLTNKIITNKQVQTYEDEKKYSEVKNAISVYNADSSKSNLTFTYPDDWQYEVIDDNGTKKEAITFNISNKLEVAFSKLSESEKLLPIKDIVEKPYDSMASYYKNTGYTVSEEGSIKLDDTDITYIKFVKDSNHFDRYSFKTETNFLGDIFIIYDSGKYDAIDSIIDSIAFSNNDNNTVTLKYESTLSSLQFLYPSKFTQSKTHFDADNNIGSDTFIYDENNSITVIYEELDISNKIFYTNLVNTLQANEEKYLSENGYKMYSSGFLSINDTEVNYFYYSSSENNINVYYYLDEYNGSKIATVLEITYTQDNIEDARKIINSATLKQ